MKDTPTHQYTIRNVPEDVDSVLRRRAKALGKSLNQVVLDALMVATDTERPVRDLSDIVGSLTEDEASCLEAEIENQRQVESKLWD